jgi:hypothetical protein
VLQLQQLPRVATAQQPAAAEQQLAAVEKLLRRQLAAVVRQLAAAEKLLRRQLAAVERLLRRQLAAVEKLLRLPRGVATAQQLATAERQLAAM